MGSRVVSALSRAGRDGARRRCAGVGTAPAPPRGSKEHVGDFADPAFAADGGGRGRRAGDDRAPAGRRPRGPAPGGARRDARRSPRRPSPAGVPLVGARLDGGRSTTAARGLGDVDRGRATLVPDDAVGLRRWSSATWTRPSGRLEGATRVLLRPRRPILGPGEHVGVEHGPPVRRSREDEARAARGRRHRASPWVHRGRPGGHRGRPGDRCRRRDVTTPPTGPVVRWLHAGQRRRAGRPPSATTSAPSDVGAGRRADVGGGAGVDRPGPSPTGPGAYASSMPSANAEVLVAVGHGSSRRSSRRVPAGVVQ